MRILMRRKGYPCGGPRMEPPGKFLPESSGLGRLLTPGVVFRIGAAAYPSRSPTENGAGGPGPRMATMSSTTRLEPILDVSSHPTPAAEASPSHAEDVALVGRILGGDSEAWKEFVERF